MPFVIDLNSVGAAGALGAQAGANDSTRQNLQMGMQAQQMEWAHQQQQFENQRQQQAMALQQMQLHNEMLYRNQQLASMDAYRQGTLGYKEQALGANTNTKLQVAGMSNQLAYDRLNQSGAQFQQTYGMKQDDFDRTMDYRNQALASRDQRAMQVEQVRQAQIAAGQDERKANAQALQTYRAMQMQAEAQKFNARAQNRASDQQMQNDTARLNWIMSLPPSQAKAYAGEVADLNNRLKAVPAPQTVPIPQTPSAPVGSNSGSSPDTGLFAGAQWQSANNPPTPAVGYAQYSPPAVHAKVLKQQPLSRDDLTALLQSYGSPAAVANYLSVYGYDASGNPVQ